MNEKQHNTDLLKSLFRGREDVFAVRWEKDGKSGYMPAYYFDPYHYRLHKMKGGTFKDYNEKTYLKLTDREIEKHLDGIQQIGLYPLLQDNTSWFLVADFDKTNWQKEAITFLNACKEQQIEAYLERSRSGNGGHVWIFFESPYPAVKSRKIFISILEESGAFSKFDKNSSFDRLFPNQDYLSGKGFGNLIALPLFKTSLEKGNSCFINPETFEPIPNQWLFLSKIKRVSISKLEHLYHNLSESTIRNTPNITPDKLQITLTNVLTITKHNINEALTNFLKEKLIIHNSEYIIKKKAGKSTYSTERFFNFIEDRDNDIVIPRGFTGQLIRFCKTQNIEFTFNDERKLKKPIEYNFNISLRSHQLEAIEATSKKNFGVIVAPPGSGKTIMGLKIIADKKQPALIIVHRKQLLNQWIDRVEAFLGFPRKDIGTIGQGKIKIGKAVTVATIQSLQKHCDRIKDEFGTIIIDECHHTASKSFHETISQLNTFYLYGLTATPFRKYNDDKIIFIQLGEIIANIKPSDIKEFKHARIVIRNTDLEVPFNSRTDNFEVLSKILVHDSNRNKLIINDISQEINKGNKVAIITERKEHIETINLFLKQQYETITLTGEDSEANKKLKWEAINKGDFQAIITTGQYFGEGTDLQMISTLFLVYPFAFIGKLIQYIGRVQRSEINPTIYDYRDIKTEYLNRLFLKRNSYYRKIEKQASLFDSPENDAITEQSTNTLIEKQLKAPIEDLEFGYGIVMIKYSDDKSGRTFELEIENSNILPEFEVLKTYFVKVLGTQAILVDIAIELNNNEIISQIATSRDIDSINKEIIESVKFRYSRGLISKAPNNNRNLITADELLEERPIYDSDEQLLNILLENSTYKHSANVKFLANQHEYNIMKIRFVLQPFSFVFLLTDKKRYHIVLETLDTEEATYIWNSDKNHSALRQTLDEIDTQLNIIREQGREEFLKSAPENFNRIIHTYTNDIKGFIIWKSLLEELLI